MSRYSHNSIGSPPCEVCRHCRSGYRCHLAPPLRSPSEPLLWLLWILQMGTVRTVLFWVMRNRNKIVWKSNIYFTRKAMKQLNPTLCASCKNNFKRSFPPLTTISFPVLMIPFWWSTFSAFSSNIWYLKISLALQFPFCSRCIISSTWSASACKIKRYRKKVIHNSSTLLFTMICIILMRMRIY